MWLHLGYLFLLSSDLLAYKQQKTLSNKMRFYLLLHQHKLKPFQDARANHYVCMYQSYDENWKSHKSQEAHLYTINSYKWKISSHSNQQTSNKKAHVGKILIFIKRMQKYDLMSSFNSWDKLVSISVLGLNRYYLNK